MSKSVMKCGTAIVAALLFLVAAPLGYRAFRQHENASELAIQTPNGIQESMFVPIGGIEQWIEIRGEDRVNPVILFVHGGPGFSVTPLSRALRSWEKDFTVVMWDQRCAGKTFVRNSPASCMGMSNASVANEGILVTEFLKDHLSTDKVIVLGHSWGSMIGLQMISDRPDLYSAYVGTGQVVSVAEKESTIYSATLERLRAANDTAGARALERVGPPPYRDFEDLLLQRRLSAQFDVSSERDMRTHMTPVALFAPGWSLWDLYNSFERAQDYAGPATFDDDATYDARQLGPAFETPMYVFNGEFDTITPTELAQSYFETVEAPAKAFVVLKGAGHSGVLSHPAMFLRELNAHVRPALSPPG